MKKQFVKVTTAGALAAMLTFSSVLAAPSITASVTAVETEITEASGVTDAQGNPVVAGSIEVISIKDEDTEDTKIYTPVSEEVKVQIETINESIQNALESGDQKEYQAAIEELSASDKIEYADETDTFDVAESVPLTKIHDVVVRDADGNIVEKARNVDVKIEVQNLTENIKDIRVLHYNIDKDKWVVIEPEIDYEAKTLSFHLDVVGPIMVVYNPEAVD